MSGRAGFNITSEIGTLQKVMVHNPGIEVEFMQPHNAGAKLYNDILPREIAVREHLEMEQLLQCFCQVYRIRDLISENIDQSAVEELLRDLDLGKNDPGKVREGLINGIPRQQNSFSNICNENKWLAEPLANLFYTRDPGLSLETLCVLLQ